MKVFFCNNSLFFLLTFLRLIRIHIFTYTPRINYILAIISKYSGDFKSKWLACYRKAHLYNCVWMNEMGMISFSNLIIFNKSSIHTQNNPKKRIFCFLQVFQSYEVLLLKLKWKHLEPALDMKCTSNQWVAERSI